MSIPVPPHSHLIVLLSGDWGLGCSEHQLIFLLFPRAEVPKPLPKIQGADLPQESVNLVPPALPAWQESRTGVSEYDHIFRLTELKSVH